MLSINSRSVNPGERVKMCCLVLLKLRFMSSVTICTLSLEFWFSDFKESVELAFSANDLRFINEKHRSCGLEFIRNSFSVSWVKCHIHISSVCGLKVTPGDLWFRKQLFQLYIWMCPLLVVQLSVSYSSYYMLVIWVFIHLYSIYLFY